MSTRDIDAIFSRWEALSGPSPRVDVWPYTLAYPIPGLSVVKEPREATGKDSRIVGRVAGDHDVLRAVVWAQVLCDLTDAQINTMDASDVEAIAKGTIPFNTGRRPMNVSQSTLPTSLSSVPGSPPNSTDC
jgi:hypothetical protein